MKRVLLTITATAVVAVLVLASVALAASGSRRADAARSQIAIKERGSAKESGYLLKGHFRLALNGVVVDSGSTAINPTAGAVKLVAGQQRTPVVGSDNLTGKKGTLTLSFRGISITINSNPSGDAYYAEYGSWKITGASGLYKGWKGGGLWANAGTLSANNIEWDGHITH